jgi:hypothetical protein
MSIAQCHDDAENQRWNEKLHNDGSGQVNPCFLGLVLEIMSTSKHRLGTECEPMLPVAAEEQAHKPNSIEIQVHAGQGCFRAAGIQLVLVHT